MSAKLLSFLAAIVLTCFCVPLFGGLAQAQSFDWAFKVGGASPGGSDSATRAVVDAGGHLYVVGSFDGTEDFDPGPGVVNLSGGSIVGRPSGYVMKLTRGGKLVWARKIGANAVVTSVAIDSGRNVVLVGTFDGTADFDPGPGVFDLTSNDVSTFVVKLDAAGALLWAQTLGGIDYSLRNDLTEVAIGEADSIVLSGTFDATRDLDPGPKVKNLTSAGWEDVFVARLGASGNLLWVRRMGGINYDASYGLAVDTDDNVILGGNFAKTADFDPGPAVYNLSAGESHDIFVWKLDAAGQLVWAKRIGNLNYFAVAYDLAVDGAGNVAVTGFFSGSMDFDPGPGVYRLRGKNQMTAFLVKLGPDGTLDWARHLQGDRGSAGNGVTFDAAGSVYAVGFFRGTTDFNPGPASTTLKGLRDTVFVWKLNRAGQFDWAVKMGGSDSEVADSIAVDASGIYTTGFFYGTADFDPGPATYNLNAGVDVSGFVSKLNHTE